MTIKEIKKAQKKEQKVQDKIWRELIYKRDNNECQRCGRTEYINAHHLLPKEIYPQHRHETWNGITLCARCHRWGKGSAHQDGVGFVSWLLLNKKETVDKILQELNNEEKK